MKRLVPIWITAIVGVVLIVANFLPGARSWGEEATTWFGIIAAVLGVVNTMGSVGQPPAVLGGMIGSALVGTFLGVLLAYGIVAPLAGRLKQVNEQDEMIFHAVKQVVIASLHGWPQPLVVESARSGLGHDFRPGLSELLDALRGR